MTTEQERMKHLEDSYDRLLLEVSDLEEKLAQREADCNYYKKLVDDCIAAMKQDAKAIEELRRGYSRNR